jgi:hypothetical protein
MGAGSGRIISVYRHRVPTTPRHGLLGVLAGAAVLPLMLSACSSSSTANGSTTTTQTASQTRSSVCALVPASQVVSIMGKQVGRPGVANSRIATTCTYPAKNSTTKSDAVIISFRGGVTAAVAGTEQAAVRKLHGTTTDVSGNGDTAYTYTVTTGGKTVTTLVTLVGTTQVTITSTASVDKIEAMAQQIFATFAAQTGSTTTTTGTTATTAAS